jgi:hypothetical protein
MVETTGNRMMPMRTTDKPFNKQGFIYGNEKPAKSKH